jgi:hypothetical protein
MGERRVSRDEVVRIVVDARRLLDAHHRRNWAFPHATLGEERALRSLEARIALLRKQVWRVA